MAGNRTSRREFLKRAGAAGAGLAFQRLAQPLFAEAPARDRPNILLMIADDWQWPHAGVYGDKAVKTPNFDRLAREGALFSHSFCAAPTCTASRAALLTGQAPHRLGEGANLYSTLRASFQVYPDLLEAAGYAVGMSGKGWGPGPIEGSGRTRNPAGPDFTNFKEFLKSVPSDKPFCFWFGSHFPHRNYEPGSGQKNGLRPGDVKVPPFLPDTPEVRADILDYLWEVQQFDRQCGAVLQNLALSGRSGNTLVVMTSDNGMPFPRAKANLYEAGTHMPLAMRWPARIKAGRTLDTLVSHTDLAPSFLDAAGLKPPPEMTGRSLLGLLAGGQPPDRDFIVTERERHVNCRAGSLSYPARAVRTKDFLYIRNFRPDLWPAGDPKMWVAVGDFGDIDTSPSKTLLLNRREDPDIRPFFDLATAKRPTEELFDIRRDPWCLKNVAQDSDFAGARKDLAEELKQWMETTSDPRAEQPTDDRWDRSAYHGVLGEWVIPKPSQ